MIENKKQILDPIFSNLKEHYISRINKVMGTTNIGYGGGVGRKLFFSFLKDFQK